MINNQELLAARASFKLGVAGARGGRDCGRRAKRSGSRTANITIGVQIGIRRWRQLDSLQSQKTKADKSEKRRVCALHASTIPLLASMRHGRLPSSSPSRGPPLSNWAHCSALRDALAGDYATFLPPSLPSAGGCGGALLCYTLQIPCSSLFSVVFSTLPLVASPSFDSAFLQLAAFLCSFT
jgi:hypothetical protein